MRIRRTGHAGTVGVWCQADAVPTGAAASPMTMLLMFHAGCFMLLQEPECLESKAIPWNMEYEPSVGELPPQQQPAAVINIIAVTNIIPLKSSADCIHTADAQGCSGRACMHARWWQPDMLAMMGDAVNCVQPAMVPLSRRPTT